MGGRRRLAVEAMAIAAAMIAAPCFRARNAYAIQRIARAETIGREFSVHFVENGTLVERRIDRLLREPIDGAKRNLVIDYKSGTADPERVARDREQVERYCRAITAITGNPCAGALWYIALESDSVIDLPPPSS